eukprot:452830-Hanusia_phi.AAC.1
MARSPLCAPSLDPCKSDAQAVPAFPDPDPECPARPRLVGQDPEVPSCCSPYATSPRPHPAKPRPVHRYLRAPFGRT